MVVIPSRNNIQQIIVLLGSVSLVAVVVAPAEARAEKVSLKQCGYAGTVKSSKVGVQAFGISCKTPICIAKSRYRRGRVPCRSRKVISRSAGWSCNRQSLMTCRRWTGNSVKLFRFCLSKRVKGRYLRKVKLCSDRSVRVKLPSGSNNRQPVYGPGQPEPDGGKVSEPEPPAAPKGPEQPQKSYNYQRESNPSRTVVAESDGSWLATFTDGSYTVTLRGPERAFSEVSTDASVATTTWVRALPEPFNGEVSEKLISQMLSDTSPDILQIEMQYIQGAEPIYDGDGLKVAGDADYGPMQEDGTRAEGSDFNDYLGIPWSYDTGVDEPETEQIGSLDCSGFVRMVFGYRGGLPVSIDPDGESIPRRSFQILDTAPGVITTPNNGEQVTDLSRLIPGDLVYFDASIDDGEQIDHVGIYLGADTSGNYRFLSSRKTPNGPTMGDTSAKSILNGSGYYASAFRAVRRL